MDERAWKIISILLLAWAVSVTALYVGSCFNTTPGNSGSMITVNLGIKYKGENVEWHNLTEVPAGTTLLGATEVVTDVNYTTYPGMGAFINSINGVENEKPYYWIWWTWNPSTGWTLGPVAADKYVLSDGETVMWYYEDTSKYPPEKP